MQPLFLGRSNMSNLGEMVKTFYFHSKLLKADCTHEICKLR